MHPSIIGEDVIRALYALATGEEDLWERTLGKMFAEGNVLVWFSSLIFYKTWRLYSFLHPTMGTISLELQSA